MILANTAGAVYMRNIPEEKYRRSVQKEVKFFT